VATNRTLLSPKRDRESDSTLPANNSEQKNGNSGQSESARQLEILPILPEDARLKLYPVLMHRITPEDCMVYRIGCPKITTVATSTLGAQAIRVLQSGKTIRQTKEILSKRLGLAEGQLDLSPVLEAIRKARIVRKVDGRVLEAERPATRRMVLHGLHFSMQVALIWAHDAVIKCLPAHTAHNLLCSAKLWRRKFKRRPLRSATEDNLQRVLGPVLPERVIKAITVQHQHEMIRRAVDAQLLRNLHPSKMERWLRDCAQFTGLDGLQAAQAEGRGVILCGFHFGSPQLLVPLLWRRGISFMGAAAMPPFRGQKLPSKLVLDSSYTKNGAPGCGTVTWHTKFSFRGFLDMMKAVERGETVLVFSDGYFDRPNREIARYFGHLAAEYSPARSGVPFLGESIPANLMVPWLCMQTRAPLFPVKLLRQKGPRFEVVIEPPLDLSAEGSIQAAAEKLYGALERDIYLHPAPWNYWGRLHQFAATPPKMPDERAGKHLIALQGK